jgi:prepilin signal peptidase PulO-like enzyme (type II secretory pathway)
MRVSRTPLRVILGWLGPADRGVIFGAGVLGGLVADLAGAPLAVLPLYAFLAAACMAITLIDFRHFLIPDLLSLPLLPAGLAAAAGMGEPLWPRAVAVAVLWLLLRVFAALAYRAKGVDAFGQGDVKLISIAGAWLSSDAIATFLLTSALTAIALHLLRNHFSESPQDRRIPFGSTLAPVLAIMAQLALINWP